MPINFRHAQELIYERLSKEEVTTLSITKVLGQMPGFNRQAFYKKYKNKFYFLGICVNSKIREEMMMYNYPKLKDNF